uniref:Uncharacterized protein n=1 Tax=Meloidogyne hapla TaxID=6305 RepID=A0A1I8B0N2_MELHA
MSIHQKIDRDSANAITNALSFFETPNTNVSVTSSSSKFNSLNPVNITPFHFKIHASTNYVDLAKCYIFTELRIRKEDDKGHLTYLEVADNVACCQLIGHTIWKNCRDSSFWTQINGTQVFEGNSLMAYKSIFDYELTYPQTVKNSYLSAAGYYDDGDIDLKGVGFENRKLLFAPTADKKQKSAQFIAKLDVDICNQPRYLVNQCKVDIELLPNDSNFLIVAPTATNPKYHLEVLACKLYIEEN